MALSNELILSSNNEEKEQKANKRADENGIKRKALRNLILNEASRMYRKSTSRMLRQGM